jgi:hypothetical protein
MARPERHDVDYFPFVAKRGKTLNILQSKYGLEGIGFFTNLLRFLAVTPDHYYCIKEKDDELNFFAEIGLENEEKGKAMIELMVKTGKLDKKLWEDHRVIACDAFLKSVEDAYKRRGNEIITIERIREIFDRDGVSVDKKPEDDASSGVIVCENDTITPQGQENYGNTHENLDNNPQTKLKESKLEESKLNTGGSIEPPGVKQSSKQKSNKPPIREREPVNDMERVEKAYLQNWDALYAQGKVKTADPVVNWNQTRKLLKTHFERIKPDVIIQAINSGMTDDFILGCGYSLGTMLSASVLNRLINAGRGQGPPPSLQNKLSLGGLDSWQT